MKQKNKRNFYTTKLSTSHFQKIVKRLSKFLVNKRYCYKLDPEVSTHICNSKFSKIKSIICETDIAKLKIIPKHPKPKAIVSTKSENVNINAAPEKCSELPTRMETILHPNCTFKDCICQPGVEILGPTTDISGWDIIDEASWTSDMVTCVEEPTKAEETLDLDECLDGDMLMRTLQTDESFLTTDVFESLQEAYDLVSWLSSTEQM